MTCNYNENHTINDDRDGNDDNDNKLFVTDFLLPFPVSFQVTE